MRGELTAHQPHLRRGKTGTGVTEGKEKKGRGNVAGERPEQGRGGSREEEDTNGGLAIAALCTSRQA